MRNKIKRLSCAVIALCLIMVWFVPAQEVSAAGDTLTIYVAYFGQSYAQPLEKATFTRAELEAMGAHSAFFTSVDGAKFCACADVYGVDLGTVLAAAGVNYWNASSLNFRTMDHTAGYATLSISYLFGTRYAFPELPLYYGTPEGEYDRRFADPENPDVPQEDIINMLWANAVSVPTMLAFSENYSRNADFSPFNGGEMSSDSAFRLFIGQTAPNEAVSRDLAAYVQSIVVLFPGPPVLTTDETELELEIGEDYRVRVNVGQTDELLMQDVLNSLQWESSDSSIVSVDQNGQLTVHGNGTATITVYAGDYYDAGGNRVSLSIEINAGNGENLGGGGSGTGEGTGDGGGSGENEGTGDGSGSGEGEEPDQSGGSGGDSESGGSGGGTSEEPTEAPGEEATQPTESAPAVTPDPQPTQPTQPDPEPTTPSTEATEPEATEPPGEDPTEPTTAPTQPDDSDQPDSDDPAEEDEELYITDQETDADLSAEQPRLSSGLKVQKIILSGSGAESSAQSSSAEAAGYEGGSEAMLLVEKNPLMVFTIVMAIVLFLSGGAVKYLLFRREL